MKEKLKKTIKKINKKHVLIIAGVFIIGTLFGAILFPQRQIFYSTQGNYETNPDFEELYDTYNLLMNSYYTDLDADTLIEGAIDGMLNAIDDPYTTYMDPVETEEFAEVMNGDYEGIGAYISIDNEGNPIIAQPFEDSPAEAAGLEPGDIILAVDYESVEGMTTEAIAGKIKGPEGTDVTITILRDGESIDVIVTRGEIVLQYVKTEIYEMNDKKIGYLFLDTFAATSYNQFVEKLNELEEQDIDSLIIDVRNNVGGYLTVATDIISEFLEKGDIVYQLEKQGRITKIYDQTETKKDYDVVVLINRYSASASEILAGALKESYGATLIGELSYGKGTVQQTEQIESGAMIKYTIEKWLTPDGNWIHEQGITPDIELEQNEEYYYEATYENDLYLQEAVKLLSE